MRWSIGTMAVIILATGWYARPANAQPVEEAPLPPVITSAEGVPLPQTAPSPQIAQSPRTQRTTEDCVQMPTPPQQTDCLNEVASGGDYMPTPAPAPGSDMPMEYRLPLGTRETTPPR